MDGSKGDAVRDEAMPYGVDTIRLRISFPAAPVSQGYNGRMWRMRPLRGWTGGAEWDAREAARRGGDYGGSMAMGSDHAPILPGENQAVPASQAVEGGGPASELLAAFRAQRMGALGGQGPAADGADAGHARAVALPSLDVIPSGAPISAPNADPYASSDMGGATVRLGTVTLSHASRLGDLSMRYETGHSPGQEGKAAGVVSSGAMDPGGVSYGAYQFASSGAGGRQVQAFLKSPEGARWADRFKDMDPTQPDGAFAHEWKRIAADEPNSFFQAQLEYIKRTHYDPVVQNVQHVTGLDINQRSRALQNVVWSTSVQHGRAASLIARAVQQVGPQGNLSNAAHDRKLIDQLYAVRNAYVDALGRPDLKTRYAAEQRDALRELEGEKP